MAAGSRIERKGRLRTVASVVFSDGTSPASEFLDSLDPSDRRKLDVLFEMMTDHGKLSNREKFKKLKDTSGLFEFKSFQVRIPCFWGSDGTLYLLFGLIKKSDNLKPSEVQRAESYRQLAQAQLGV